MSKKMFVFDIDGTLLTSENQLLPSTTIALNYLKSKGHKVVLATGRSRFLIKKLLNELKIEDYIVCNGSAAFLKNKQVYKQVLEPDRLANLLTYFQRAKIDVALTSLDNFCRISSYQVEQMEQTMQSIGAKIPEYNPTFLQKNEIYQGLCFCTEMAGSSFERNFSDFRFVRWHKHFVDVVPKHGSKAVTLLRLAEEMNIKQKDIIAFGDENNDIEMLQAAGIGIAMGNANPSVQSAADYVTAKNDEDGIVQALERLRFLS